MTTGDGDILVACVKSGLVMTLEETTPDRFGAGPTMDEVRRRIEKEGTEARILGQSCARCILNRVTCQYRPLRGPLFIPRPT